MYTAASLDPDANPMGGGQLPSPESAMYANEYKETLSPNPNECNSTLTSGTSQGAAPTYTIYTEEGANYLTLTLFKPREVFMDPSPKGFCP